MTGPRLVAYVHSSHLGRSHAFYSGVLGLERSIESAYANEYDAHGTPLRVTLAPRHEPSRYTVLGWRVGDLERAIAELRERGVVFRSFDGYDADDNGVWTGPGGVRIAWFEDPDGNIISLHQGP